MLKSTFYSLNNIFFISNNLEKNNNLTHLKNKNKSIADLF